MLKMTITMFMIFSVSHFEYTTTKEEEDICLSLHLIFHSSYECFKSKIAYLREVNRENLI